MLSAALICLLTPFISLVSAQNPAQIIAVATRDEDTQISDIYSIQLNGENRTNLTRHPSDDIWPAWSPDGTQIAFASDRDGSYDIWLMQEDGSNPIRVTHSAKQDFRPTWSPDGSHIMFLGNSGDKDKRSLYRDFDLYLIRLEDGLVAQLTYDDLRVVGYGGSWSPDGTRIMFAAKPNNGLENHETELFVLNVDDARRLLQVSNDIFFGASPFWIAENEFVLFSQESPDSSDDSEGFYKVNPVTGDKQFLIYPFNIYTAVGFESETVVMLFDGLDGICYFNTQTGEQVFVDNTGPFDDSMSWKPTAPEHSAGSALQHKFRRGQC